MLSDFFSTVTVLLLPTEQKFLQFTYRITRSSFINLFLFRHVHV